MKYYRVIVSFLVEAEEDYTAQQKAISGKALLHYIKGVEQAPPEIEATINQLIQSRPEKGLW